MAYAAGLSRDFLKIISTVPAKQATHITNRAIRKIGDLLTIRKKKKKKKQVHTLKQGTADNTVGSLKTKFYHKHKRFSSSTYLIILNFDIMATYHFYLLLHRAFFPVSRVPGGVGPGSKRTRQSRDHSQHVFLDDLMDISLHTGSLGHLPCIQPRDSGRTQMDNQQ